MQTENTTIVLSRTIRACPKEEQSLQDDNACTGDSGTDLVPRILAGDESALDQLAGDWGPRLFRYVARYLDDTHMCQDLTQETLLRAVGAIKKGTRPRDLEAWLYRIATNLIRDQYRSAYHNRVEVSGLSIQPCSELRSPEELMVSRCRQAAVRRALAVLSPDLREVVNFRYYEGFPVWKIAEILGIPEGTVKSRLYRAYRRLEKELVTWIDEDRQGRR